MCMNQEMIVGIAATVGAVSGGGLDVLAIRKLNREDHAFSETIGVAHEQLAGKRVGLAQKVARTVLAPLTLVGAIAFAAETAGNLPSEQIPASEATLQAVIDHSGGTDRSIFNGTKTVTTINELAAKLGTKKVNGRAIVAGNNTITSMRIEEVASNAPVNGAPITNALTLALNSLKPSANKGSVGLVRTSGVVLITNGNGIEGKNDVISTAQEQHTPIYVVNVEKAAETKPETEAALQQLAKQTQGAYWHATESNLDEITHKVVANLRPEQPKQLPDPWRNLLRVIGVAAFAVGVRQFASRAHYTTGREAKEI
jgi:hypothetical protein